MRVYIMDEFIKELDVDLSTPFYQKSRLFILQIGFCISIVIELTLD